MTARQHYMLDTNMASYVIKGYPAVVRDRLRREPGVCVSAITQAELLYGVAKKPDAKQLPLAVNEFLLRVDILPWDSDVAQAYADLRSSCEQQGISLSALDMLIAAHSVAAGTVLVSHDRAFYQIKHALRLVDWCLPLPPERNLTQKGE